MENKWKNVLTGAGFYATLSACLLIVAVGGYFLLLRDKPSSVEDAPSQQNIPSQEDGVSGQDGEPGKTLDTPVTDVYVPESPEAVETVSPEPVVDIVPTMPEVPVDDTPVVAEAPMLTVSPLNGEVLTVFSMDELVYNPTLADWRTHDGVDISAKPGTTVLAASPGTVSAVSEDPLMGTFVTIDHDGGYQTTYANLQETPTVSVGEYVSAGQVIGAVGMTAAAEAAQSPHLHFSVMKDGDTIDPSEFLDQ